MAVDTSVMFRGSWVWSLLGVTLSWLGLEHAAKIVPFHRLFTCGTFHAARAGVRLGVVFEKAVLRESTPWNLGGKPCTWHVAWMFVGEPTMKLSKSPTGKHLRPLSHGNPHPRTYDIHVVLPRRSRVDVVAVFTYSAPALVTALQF